MSSERTEAQQKDSPVAANAEKIAAQVKTPAHTSSYYPPQGLSLAGSGSADDIPLTPDNLLYLQRTIGNRSVVQLLQRKGKLSQPGDAYEREADRVAEQVVDSQPVDSPSVDSPSVDSQAVDAPSHASVSGRTSTPQISRMPVGEECSECRTEIQRQPAGEEEQRKRPEEEASLQMKEAEGAGDKEAPCTCCEKGCGKQGHLQAKEDDKQPPESTSDVEPKLESSNGGGQPLPEPTREYFESRIGHDFSGVRVHTDSAAVEMNRNLNARAFTHEDHIYFNAGEYPPSTDEGKRILAHELTHTIQQTGDGDMLQRYSAPPQDVTLDPEPERPDDGAQVEGRMNAKIENDPNVQNQDDLDEEEAEEAKKPDRGEVRQETSAINSSGQSKPSVDRGAAAQEKTEAQKAEIDEELSKESAEAEEEKGKEEEEKPKLSEADAAAQRAEAAKQQAQAVEIPAQPEPFKQPRIEAPVDSAGEPLPRNSKVDTQVRGLGEIGQMLRDQGYEMKRHAADLKSASYEQDAVLAELSVDLANAKEGTGIMGEHNKARQEIATQSREAHGESVERQQFVAEKAPDLASKADEGKSDSNELAGEARSRADQSKGEIPDDEDARADAEQQSGEMEDTAQKAVSMDEAITQTAARARQYEQDAVLAAEQNQQSEAQIAETEGVIAQTDARVAEMNATNAASQAKIENASYGPGLIRQYSQQTAESGDELIAATIVMEKELSEIQEEYLSGMAGIESREVAVKRQQEEQEKAEQEGQAELSAEEQQVLELGGMGEEEQEARIAEMDQPERDGLMAALEKMIQKTPENEMTGAEATEGARVKVDTGLSKAIMGEPAPDPRAGEIQEVENRRIERVGGVLDIADHNMSFLTEEQQRMLANKLVAESITDDIKNINVLQMGKQMIKAIIDPRVALVGAVGGFEKMMTGIANIGNAEAWARDPVGNLLQIAADITTGLATIFSSILAIAALITALMVALTIFSWGFLSFMTLPVIGWMGTVMTYAGWGAIIAGGLAVYFNYLAYIKNLHDAGTAETARELFGNTEQMKQNATDGFQGAMAVVEGIGAVKMGPKLSSKQFLDSIPRSPGQFAKLTVQGVKEGASRLASAPALIARGARQLLTGGRKGLIRFRERIRAIFSRRRPVRPGDVDVDVDTPQSKQQQKKSLAESRGKDGADVTDAEIKAELKDAANSEPRVIDSKSEHFKDYDMEIEANGHTYRRRRDGQGWCRFTRKRCGVSDADFPPAVKKKVRAAAKKADLGTDITEDVKSGKETKPGGEDWKQMPNWDKWTERGGTIKKHADGSITLTTKDGVSVKYSPTGDPDFTPHLDHPSGVKSVEIQGGFSESRTPDYRKANQAAGHPEWGDKPPDGYRWHHTRDGKTMQLVPVKVHSTFKHSGGVSLL